MIVNSVFKLFGGGIAAALAVFEIHTNSSFFLQKSSDSGFYIKTWLNKINHVFSSFDSNVSINSEKDFNKDIKKWDWNWDGKHVFSETDSHKQKVQTGIRHLFLIRHGQYHYSDDDVDCHLTSLGREQLNYTGMRLKELNFPYKKLYYSTMTRAIESAEIILDHLTNVPAEPNSDLREGAPCYLEPPLQYYQPSEQQIKEDGPRIENAFRTYFHRSEMNNPDDTYEIYVCHANVIRYFVCRALQLSPEGWIRFTLDHGSITYIAIRPNGCVSLKWLGNSGHMPSEKLSVS